MLNVIPDVYTKLRQRLEEFAIPLLPGKGILEFLRCIFTELEAEMLSKFRSFTELVTPEQFAHENGHDSKIVRKVFSDLARRNLINYVRKEGKNFFGLQPFVVGFYEAYFSTWRQQNPEALIPAAKAMQEYLQDTFHKALSNSKSPWARIIPSMNAIETLITEDPEYTLEEIEITLIDRIRRLGAIIQYGARIIIRKLFSGKIRDLINTFKYDVIAVAKRMISLSGLRRRPVKSYQMKRNISGFKKQKTLDINKEVSMIMKIHPYEVIRHYIDQATSIFVTPCPCRKAKKLHDEISDETQKAGCEFPVEDTCFNLRYSDQILNEYNLTGGHVISKEEALDILNRCEEAGLVHTSYNSREKIEFICNCCPCCCGILSTMTKYHQKYRAFVESNFQPTHQVNKCVKCGKCMQICPVHAISLDVNRFPIIDFETCIGCGICVSNCSKKALKLIKIKNHRPAIDAIEALVKFANQKLKN